MLKAGKRETKHNKPKPYSEKDGARNIGAGSVSPWAHNNERAGIRVVGLMVVTRATVCLLVVLGAGFGPSYI